MNIKSFLVKLKNYFLGKFSSEKKSISKTFGRIGSYPYISGDSFLLIADSFMIKLENGYYFGERTKKKNLIFIENGLLSIKTVFNKAIEYKKVILHNGDKPPNDYILQAFVNKKINVFGTNLKFKNKYIEPIPIGLQNAYRKWNGDLSYYNPINLSTIKIKKENILLISFTIHTNPKVRKDYISILKKYNYKNKYFRNLKEYRNKLASSYFVICPPGNGIDCHRTWEALIHKTIPVIEKKYYLFSHIDLPILLVDNIKQFLDYSNEEKIKIYKKIIRKPFEKIYMQWWIDYIINK